MALAGDELEAELRRLCDASEWSAAVTTAIEGYGPEVLGFVYAALRDEDDARDAFSIFSEALWRNVAQFRWQCSFRTWTYALARSALGRVRRDPRRQHRLVRLSEAPAVENIVDRVRTATLSYLKGDVAARVHALRQSLDPDDQTLLTLRIDRGMAWREVAMVMLGIDAQDAQLAREAGKLRKRFERIKQRLREQTKAA